MRTPMNRSLLLAIVLLFSVLLSHAQNKYTRSADESFADQQYSLALKKYQKA